MPILVSIAIIIVSSALIYLIGKKFAVVSSNIGDYIGLPRDIKGATFDAISGSLPEMLVALYSVVFFHKFEVGVGTITGSALFNLLIIPGICVFLAPSIFKVSKKVISRDALFYMISIFTLIVLLLYFPVWGFGVAVLLLAIYAFYLKDITYHARIDRRIKEEIRKKVTLKKEVTNYFLLLFTIAASTFFLTDAAIALAASLGVAPVIIAFTVVSTATSVPDVIIATTNARKGDIDDATSSVFGSNVFDILLGIGLPLFIYNVIQGPVRVVFENTEIVLGLLGATILLLYMFADDRILEKKQAAFLLFMYFVFVAYVVYLSLI